MANTPRQRESWRDAIRFDNETDRYNLDSDLSRWKNSVTDLQSKMNENKIAMRKANNRYAQVVAAGGSGDYGINKYSTQSDLYRKQIEGSTSGLSTKPKLGNTLIKPLSQINEDIVSNQNRIKQIDDQVAKAIADNKFDPLNPRKTILSERDLAQKITTIKGSSLGPNYSYSNIQDRLKESNELLDEQKPFEEDEIKKANDYNERIKRLEQEFIQSTLNAPEPQPVSLRGIKEEKTPQQISMERDQVINSSLGDDLSIQKVAPSQKKPYLAKQQNSLPLRGYTMSNLRGASQRVSGATLGGNTNRLQ